LKESCRKCKNVFIICIFLNSNFNHPAAVTNDTFNNTHPIHSMAALTEKFAGNIQGRFYVDQTCIDCGMCPDIAPLTFRRHDEAGQSYVWQQPTTPSAIALTEEALASCPAESIGEVG